MHANLAHTHRFNLKDRDGEEHSYIVTLHPAQKGQRIMFALFAMASGTLGKIIEQVAGIPKAMEVIQSFFADGNEGDEEAGEEATPALDMDLVAMISQVNWSEVGADVRMVLADIAAPDLLTHIMACTVRDSQDLSKATSYNLAYRGNYIELLHAAYEVIALNGFFPVPAISLDVSGKESGTSQDR